MTTHSLKGTFDKLCPQNQWWCHCDVISQSISTKFCIFVFFIPRGISVQNMSKVGQETNKLQNNGKWRHCDVISENSSAIFVCEYFLLIFIDVPSFKLIQGQIKELQGVVPSTPWAENDQKKSPSRIGLNVYCLPDFLLHMTKLKIFWKADSIWRDYMTSNREQIDP